MCDIWGANCKPLGNLSQTLPNNANRVKVTSSCANIFVLSSLSHSIKVLLFFTISFFGFLLIFSLSVCLNLLLGNVSSIPRNDGRNRCNLKLGLGVRPDLACACKSVHALDVATKGWWRTANKILRKVLGEVISRANNILAIPFNSWDIL